ncbi:MULTISPECIES: hypothetical protein [Kordiimonas]|jgi:hypothetical protein|uniref:Uncharacterized protein n=1 Tax=Kordiimonas lacus TaxID=637679 RepID=A0A1G7ASV6_9PROT|nr:MULTISPECIES: hypothetical protein [Kordiimonas]SDE17871.1 hypothetical protein SAMN04488071_2206 [Kordiimonas lacus]
MKRFLLIAASVVALGGVAYWALYVMGRIEGVELSGHGVVAMIIGLLFTILIGFGLMALIFFSNKHGHDEAVHNLYTSNPTSNDDDDKS